MPKLTRIFFILQIFPFLVYSKDFYYLDKVKGCSVRTIQNKVLETVPNDEFINKVIHPQILKKNPKLVAFKINGIIYLTPLQCVMNNEKNSDLDEKEFESNPFEKKVVHVSEVDKFKTQKYFLDLDLGTFKISAQKALGDYNQIFPSVTVNPTQWRNVEPGPYKSTSIISLGIGKKLDAIKYMVFKLRILNGKKSDDLVLYDINSSTAQAGSWISTDTFQNIYLGFKYLFFIESAWKPSLGIYAGASRMNTTLTDANSTFNLSSLGPALLAEVGLEYLLNSHYGLGVNYGYEYLGSRSMKFEDIGNHQNFKTNLSYSNSYLIVGFRIYF